MKYHKIKLPANKPFEGLKRGTFALVTKEAGILKAEQIEAARMAMQRILKKQAKMWTIPTCNKSYTKKPAETRMGKGKTSFCLYLFYSFQREGSCGRLGNGCR